MTEILDDFRRFVDEIWLFETEYWAGSEFLCDCSCPWYPACSTDDPTHDGGRPVCPSGAPWHGHCPQGCRLNQNKPTPAGPGPDLGIGQALQLLNCSSAQGQWKEPGPPGGVKTLDNTSTTWSEYSNGRLEL